MAEAKGRVTRSPHNVEVTRRGLILFASLGIAWGIPYLFIKVAVEELAPELVVLARSAIAAAILLPLAAWRGELAPVLARWKPIAAYTIVEIVIPWYALSTAEKTLPSSTAGLLLATVPLFGLLIAWAMGRPARFTASNWLGVALGMVGVAALVGLDVGGSGLGAVGLMVITAAGYALGPAILSRWVPELPGVGVTAVSLGAAALVYVPFVWARQSWPSQLPSAGVIVAIVVLAVVCSALAFVLMIELIAEIGPVRSTTITYVNPAVAILAGALFLREKVSAWTLLGLVLVLAGSALATRKSSPRSPEEGGREEATGSAPLADDAVASSTTER